MNSFGRIFRITIFGESHGPGVGILIDGVPPGIQLDESMFVDDLKRRKPGAFGTTPRIESDQPKLDSGVFNGHSTGAPLLIRFENRNINSSPYLKQRDIPRPGHADFTSRVKYRGYQDFRGGGAFSGRLTLGLVAAGVVAKRVLPDMRIESRILEASEGKLSSRIEEAVQAGDSVGAVIECKVNGLEIGLGEPFFDSCESMLSHLIFSIPGIKGIEFGSGFMVAEKRGSQVNDTILDELGKTETNHSGGINGGLTNGNELLFRVAVRPTPSISRAQESFNFSSKRIESFKIEGRHDSCFALRLPVVIEAVTAIILADLHLLNQKYGE